MALTSGAKPGPCEILDYDVFPDGRKFLVNTITTEETPDPLSLVLNWTAELKK